MSQVEELAEVVNDVAEQCERPWEVGHELAKRWTESGRSMTSAEVALARLFQFQLDVSDQRSMPYRNWWPDEGADEEIEAESLEAWAEVVPHLENSWAVAHTSDLLWVKRFGNQPYEWAIAAIEHYREAASEEQDDRIAFRFLLRALGLAGEINHVDQRAESERTVMDRLEAVVLEEDRAPAISTAVRLRSEDLGAPAVVRLQAVLDSLWSVVETGAEKEKVGKALLSYSDSETRLLIAEGVIEAFRSDASGRHDMGKLLSLREAVRVAEEMGHPSHSAILHEIETLDSEDIFQRVRSEQVMSRSDVSDFCAAIAGRDSLQNALLRFVANSPLTPQVVESIRASTEVGIRHAIQRHQIGEANSVVTTSEGDDHSIEAAVDRDVRQTAGFNGQVTSFLFLSPALHQALDAYHPWSDEELTLWIEGDTCDGVVSSALVRSLDHFRNRRYDEVVHILVPRVERQIRLLARACGVATTKRPTARVGGIRGLGEIVADLRAGRASSGPLLPEPLITSVELLLVDPESLNLRNEVAHGVSGLGEQWQATLLIQLGLAIAVTIQLGEAPPA